MPLANPVSAGATVCRTQVVHYAAHCCGMPVPDQAGIIELKRMTPSGCSRCQPVARYDGRFADG
jgi:hypothetical protein